MQLIIEWSIRKLAIASGIVLLLAAGPACRSSNAARDVSSAAALHGIREVSVAELQIWVRSGQPFVLIDVREDNEWQSGHAASALHIPRWTLEGRMEEAVPLKSSRIVLYCRTGVRSVAACTTLKRLGYTDVCSLAGGFQQYQQAGLPVVQ